MTLSRLSLVAIAALALSSRGVFAEPIAIAEVQHQGDVDFEKEILPLFRRNCLACHSATEAESDLVLETPQTILKGGSEGPAVVAGKGAESLLLKMASKQKEPHMPPPDNDVKAKPLSPQELGLIKLWIDQGAKGDVMSASSMITWQPLPPGINPIYAVAITADGQYAAASRANQIFLYHVPSKRELGRLTDPSLIDKGVYKQPGVADLDLIQSLKFSPDGQWLASGGFRTVKLWHKPAGGKRLDLAAPEGPARSIAVSADSKFAAIGEETGKVKVFDLSNGQIAKTLAGHGGPVTGVAFTADGIKLVTGSLDKTFRVFNLADSQQIASIETPSPINAVAIVGEGKLVATAGADNMLRTWDLPAMQPAEAAKPVKEIGGHGGPINSLFVLTPNGAKVLTACQDGVVRVVDIASGNIDKQMNHGAPVVAAAARSDLKRIATIAANNSVKLWDADNGQQLTEQKGDFRAGLKLAETQRTAALAKKHVELAKADFKEAEDRKKAEDENQKKSMEALAKADGEFKPKDEAFKKAAEEKAAADKALAEGTAAKTKSDEAKKATDELVAKADQALKSAKASVELANKVVEGDGALKAAAEKAAADVDILRKALEPEKQLADKVAGEAQAALMQADEKVKQVAPNFQKATDERTAAERTLQTAQRGVERAAEAVKKATEAIPGVDAKVKASEATAQQRDQEVQTATAALPMTEKPFKAIAFAPDGATFAAVGDDQLLHTYSAENGAPVETYAALAAPINVVAFTADGAAIAAAANNTGVVWDFATEWKLARTIGSPEKAMEFTDRVTALDFSPDGKLIAVGGGEPSRSGEIKIYSTETGQLVLAIKEPHSDTVNCLDFSPDGQQLASCAADRFVKLWNAADGKFVRSFEGHTHHVLGVTWRADGRMLATSGADMVVKIWDTRTGDQLRTVQNQFNKEVTSVQFVGDSDLVVTTGGDNRVRFVNASNGGIARDFSGTADYMYAGAASADGKTILAGGLDSVLRVWNDQGAEFAKFTAPAPPLTAAK